MAGGSSPTGAGALIAVDRAGRTVTDATVDIAVPRPVAVTEAVIVVQSDGGRSGAGPAAAASQPVRLAGIDRATGATRWTRPLTGVTPGVLAAGGTLVVPLGQVLDGIDAGSGRTLWGRPRGRAVVVLDERTVAAVTDAGTVQAVDARTGAVRWAGPEIQGRLTGLVALGTGAVLVATSDDRLIALGTADGGVLWSDVGPRSSPSSQWDEPRPAAVSGGVWATLLEDGSVAGVRVEADASGFRRYLPPHQLPHDATWATTPAGGRRPSTPPCPRGR